MRMTVGYLATPSGADGIALGSLLATTLGSDLDICLVLEETRRVPAKGGIEIDYDEIIAAKARQWLIEAVETVPDGIAAEPVLAKSESFAEGLLAVADDTGAEMIVVGAAGDGLIGRHSIGTVTGELLHCAPLPLALAPRGFRLNSAERVRSVTCAVGLRVGAEHLMTTAIAFAAQAQVPLRLLSLVSIDHLGHGEDPSAAAARGRDVEHARTILDEACTTLGTGADVEVLVAEGATIEDAAKRLQWEDGDILMVGSSRLAQPRTLFVGSTVTKLLRVVPVPVIVVPKGDNR